MHILLIPSWYPTPNNPIYGVFFREQAEALRRAGHRVGVLHLHVRSVRQRRGSRPIDRSIRRRDENDVVVFATERYGWPRLVPRANATLWRRVGAQLFDAYAAECGRPDIIHAHSAVYGAVSAAALGRRNGLPTVLTEHSTIFARGLLRPAQRRIVARSLEAIDAKLTVSPALGHVLEDIFGASSGPWSWVPNILDRRFADVDLADRRESDDGRFRFLNIALVDAKKGQDDLLYAFADAFRGDRSAELRIGGDGPARGRLEALAGSLGIAGQVRFLGMLGREDVRREMLAADVFVLPSHYETFGIVVIEALACGTPVVATRCGGPEHIVGSEDGLLVPLRDPAALSAAMLDARRHHARYCAEGIRERCLQRFHERVVVAQLVAVYDRLLRGGRHVPA